MIAFPRGIKFLEKHTFIREIKQKMHFNIKSLNIDYSFELFIVFHIFNFIFFFAR